MSFVYGVTKSKFFTRVWKSLITSCHPTSYQESVCTDSFPQFQKSLGRVCLNVNHHHRNHQGLPLLATTYHFFNTTGIRRKLKTFGRNGIRRLFKCAETERTGCLKFFRRPSTPTSALTSKRPPLTQGISTMASMTWYSTHIHTHQTFNSSYIMFWARNTKKTVSKGQKRIRFKPIKTYSYH